MSNCSSPEQGPRRILTAHVDSYLQYLAGFLPEEMNNSLPLGDIAIIPDGLIASVLVARVMEGEHPHPAMEVLLEKEIDTDRLLLETFAIPTHTVTVQEARVFDQRVSSYWAELCARGRKPVSPQLKMRLPRASHTPIAEAFYDMNVAEPVPFSIQPFEELFGAVNLSSGQSFHIPLSAVFFASSINRLRQLKHQADIVKRDNYKHNKAMEKIYVCLCTMLLYFLSMTNDTTADALKFSSRDWTESRRLADEFGSEIFGSFGYRQNRIFLERVHEHFGTECRKAAEWWCKGAEGQTGRRHLEQGFARMETVLHEIFGIERAPVASSSHVASHSPSKRPSDTFFPRARNSFDFNVL